MYYMQWTQQEDDTSSHSSISSMEGEFSAHKKYKVILKALHVKYINTALRLFDGVF